jgi:hypothetical protein
MNILQSLSDWITAKKPLFPSLSGVSVVLMGDESDLSPPFLGLVESGSAPVEQNDVIMHGVSAYEVTAELHTVPASEDEEGTPAADERQMRFDLYDIIANRDAIPWITGENQWTIFDIRAAAPTTEAQDGRRVSRFMITVIASPL